MMVDLLAGPNVIAENAEATAEAFTEEGWFRTGDLGAFDEDGYLSIVGRSKDLIITGGYNVHPREVEEALLAHPAVAEAAVVGRPSAEWGEAVTAFVVPDGPADPDELRAHAATLLAGYKVPKTGNRPKTGEPVKALRLGADAGGRCPSALR